MSGLVAINGELRVDEIKNFNNNGSPNFPFGIGGRTITLADDGEINIDAIFSSVADGEYLVMQTDNSLMFGVFMYKKGTPSFYTIVSGNPNFVGGNIEDRLCLVESGNDIVLKNRLGSQRDFTIHRRTV